MYFSISLCASLSVIILYRCWYVRICMSAYALMLKFVYVYLCCVEYMCGYLYKHIYVWVCLCVLVCTCSHYVVANIGADFDVFFCYRISCWIWYLSVIDVADWFFFPFSFVEGILLGAGNCDCHIIAFYIVFVCFICIGI